MLRFQIPPSSVSQKSRKMNPLQLPQQGPLWRELPVSRAFFNMFLKFLITFLLIKEMFPLWKEMSVSIAFVCITFRVPSNGAPPPPASPHRAPIQRDAPFPEPSINYQSSR